MKSEIDEVDWCERVLNFNASLTYEQTSELCKIIDYFKYVEMDHHGKGRLLPSIFLVRAENPSDYDITIATKLLNTDKIKTWTDKG